MKRYVVFTALLALFAGPVLAQQPTLTARPGSTGIYLNFGAELPKTFRYRLERSPAGQNQWQTLAETFFPRLSEEFAGRLAEAVAQMPPSPVQMPNTPLANARYAVLTRSRSMDSLGAFTPVPHYQIAAGVGYWDGAVQPNTNYDYRLTRVAQGSGPVAVPPSIVPAVRFPGRYAGSTLAADTITANGPSVTLRYVLTDGAIPDQLTLYRAYYLRGDYKPVPARFFPVGLTKKGQPMFSITDASVADKLQYAYYVVPSDFYGNQGLPTSVKNVYNARPQQVIFNVQQFRVLSRPQQNALHLSWWLVASPEITSVDVFRSDSFDGTYRRLASVSAQDTAYDDRTVLPVRTYFYSLVVNTTYGRAYPSARVPALLEANQPNDSPVQNVRASQQGRVVTLRFKQPDYSIYGYYVYRAEGYRAKLQQVGSVRNSLDSLVTLTDTLPDTNVPVWTYAVASVNTSYNISAPSERVTLSGAGRPQPPADLAAQEVQTPAGGRAVRLIWTDSLAANATHSGYYVLRRTTDFAYKPLEDWRRLTAQPLDLNRQLFTDATVQPGRRYAYAVVTVGSDTSVVSSRSNEAGAYLEALFPAGVRNVRALAGGQRVVVQWDAPFDEAVARLVVYRAAEGQKPQRLKELPAQTRQFVDDAPRPKTTNYYVVVSEDKQGNTSRNPARVGVYVE